MRLRKRARRGFARETDGRHKHGRQLSPRGPRNSLVCLNVLVHTPPTAFTYMDGQKHRPPSCVSEDRHLPAQTIDSSTRRVHFRNAAVPSARLRGESPFMCVWRCYACTTLVRYAHEYVCFCGYTRHVAFMRSSSEVGLGGSPVPALHRHCARCV